MEVGWERGLGVACEEGEEVVDILSKFRLVDLNAWIESVCVGTSRVFVCPELDTPQLLVRFQGRHLELHYIFDHSR